MFSSSSNFIIIFFLTLLEYITFALSAEWACKDVLHGIYVLYMMCIEWCSWHMVQECRDKNGQEGEHELHVLCVPA